MSLLMKMIDAVLPPRCIVTGDMVAAQGLLSPNAWMDLNFITDPQCHRCGFPFDFDSGEVKEGNICASCAKEPPIFTRARAALIYDDASRHIILGYKHADQTHYLPSFTPWLKNAAEEILEQADYLIPVPLHRWRLLKRRFNQSALIAQYLSKETNIPVLLDALNRTRATVTQGHLKTKERKKNVRNAFSVDPDYWERLRHKKLVLIDDVFTTGATVSECAKALLKAGASSVDVVTLARVMRAKR